MSLESGNILKDRNLKNNYKLLFKKFLIDNPKANYSDFYGLALDKIKTKDA